MVAIYAKRKRYPAKVRKKPSLQKQCQRKKEALERSLQVLKNIGLRRQVHEFDLEKDTSCFNGQVCMMDSVVLKTKNSEFEIVFLGVKKGKLDCLLFMDRNLRKEEPSLGKSEKIKIWGGILGDGSPFQVSIIRIPVHIQGDGHIANVALNVHKQERIFFGH